MFAFWQNLNEDQEGNVKGSGFWTGRAWLRFGPHSNGPSGHVEWCFGPYAHHASLRLEVGGGDSAREILFSAGLPRLANLYLGVEEIPFRRRFPRVPHREVSLAAHGGQIWWRVWADPDSWESTTPRWRDGNLDVVKLLLGEVVQTKRVLETRQVVIPFPERLYTARVTLEAWEERRPRWPVTRRWRGVDVLPATPIPEPGKGENSWDCGDDATYRMYLGGASSIDEGVERFQDAVLRTRERRGGKNWRPSPEHLAMCERTAPSAEA